MKGWCGFCAAESMAAESIDVTVTAMSSFYEWLDTVAARWLVAAEGSGVKSAADLEGEKAGTGMGTAASACH
ncbi:hypothetical protein ACWF94_10030 [Streptomyces sp. NPDC055078]